jgi:hypothetical protein
MRRYENNVFKHPLRNLKNFIKLAYSFSFFEVRAHKAGPIWIEEAEIDLKCLKWSSPK